MIDIKEKINNIISEFQSGFTESLDDITDQMIADDAVQQRLYTEVLTPLLKEREHALTDALLDRMLRVRPDDLGLLLIKARVMAFQKSDKLISVLDQLGGISPHDPRVVISQLQGYLQNNKLQKAAQVAFGYPHWKYLQPKAVYLALLALMRTDNSDEALKLAENYDGEPTAEIAGMTIQLLRQHGSILDSIALGERHLANGFDNAEVHAQLGYSYERNHAYDTALAHITKSLEHEPRNGRVLATAGQLHLMKGHYERAEHVLADALEVMPDNIQTRLLYARALKGQKKYDAAASEFLRVSEADPKNSKTARFAAAALKQAGDIDGATRIFDKLILERESNLPKDFNAGLKDLWNQIDTVRLPQKRLDWAWQLYAKKDTSDREEWERRAKWGYLADAYVYDWLECRTEQAEQIMYHLSDLDESTALLVEIMGQGKGMIVASAHIGLMYAGPLALELLEFKSKWLASTPSIPTAGYFNALISTSDQTEAQVVREAVRAIDASSAVTVAVDGAMTAASPRIMFEGEEITYSSFAARLAYRKKVRSVFATPQWRNGAVTFYVRELPFPEDNESIEDFMTRWQASYLEELRTALSMEPENLRLNGGIWRFIKDD